MTDKTAVTTNPIVFFDITIGNTVSKLIDLVLFNLNRYVSFFNYNQLGNWSHQI